MARYFPRQHKCRSRLPIFTFVSACMRELPHLLNSIINLFVFGSSHGSRQTAFCPEMAARRAAAMHAADHVKLARVARVGCCLLLNFLGVRANQHSALLRIQKLPHGLADTCLRSFAVGMPRQRSGAAVGQAWTSTWPCACPRIEWVERMNDEGLLSRRCSRRHRCLEAPRIYPLVCHYYDQVLALRRVRATRRGASLVCHARSLHWVATSWPRLTAFPQGTETVSVPMGALLLKVVSHQHRSWTLI